MQGITGLRTLVAAMMCTVALAVSATAQHHTADTSANQSIELGELLRVIQFFNTGGLRCQDGTEDGYAPGIDAGQQGCAAHDSDYSAQDWQVNLSELLRLIQFFNAGRYFACPSEGTEDGFCPLFVSGGGEGEGEGEPPPSPPEMVFIPAGPFMMGDTFGEGNSDELPVHEVTLSAYRIGEYVVTNQEYADILNWAKDTGRLTYTSGDVQAYGETLLEVTSQYCQISYSGGQFVVESRDGHSMADHPVVELSWYGAAVYCNWLSERQGLMPCYDTSTWTFDSTQNGYHLPTEAQWERAAAWSTTGGGYRYRYGNGSDSISCDTVNHQPVNYCNPLGLSNRPYTSPVGYYAGVTSPAGCFDMSGNVWEWCGDWYSSGYYGESATTDPQGPSTGTRRVVRGGSWVNWVRVCRTSYRGMNTPTTSFSSHGFRLCISVSPGSSNPLSL